MPVQNAFLGKRGCILPERKILHTSLCAFATLHQLRVIYGETKHIYVHSFLFETDLFIQLFRYASKYLNAWKFICNIEGEIKLVGK